MPPVDKGRNSGRNWVNSLILKSDLRLEVDDLDLLRDPIAALDICVRRSQNYGDSYLILQCRNKVTVTIIDVTAARVCFSG